MEPVDLNLLRSMHGEPERAAEEILRLRGRLLKAMFALDAMERGRSALLLASTGDDDYGRAEAQMHEATVKARELLRQPDLSPTDSPGPSPRLLAE